MSQRGFSRVWQERQCWSKEEQRRNLHFPGMGDSSKYGLRAGGFSRRSRRQVFSQEDVEHPAAKATIAAGLRLGTMLKAERQLFQGCSAAYMQARNMLLQRWHANDRQYFSLSEALEMFGDEDESGLLRRTWRFLHEQAYINTGVLHDDPSQHARPAPLGPDGPTDAELTRWVVEKLQKADMTVTTVKSILNDAGQKFGMNMKPRKPIISGTITQFLEASKAGQDPFAALGLETQQEAPNASDMRKVQGRVIVVGAGPAGLAAALHLKKCGVEAVVLEARERVGGRVYTQHGGGFTAPVDLGASIITGTEPSVEKGLCADPSAQLARQLGVELHNLLPDLKLFDGVTGRPATQEEDDRAERLMNALMDDARAKVDSIGAEKTKGMSLGDALDTAFAHRITLPAGDQEHMGAPIADTAAAQLPDPTAGQPAELGPGSMEQGGATQLPVDLGMMVAGADISGLPEADMAKAAAATVAASGTPSGEDPAQAALDAVFGGDTSRQGSLQQQQEQERQRQGEGEAVKQDAEADFLAYILADPEEKKEGDAAPAQLSQWSEVSGAAANSGSAPSASAAPRTSPQADGKPAEAAPADSKQAVVHKTEPGDPESMAAAAEVAGSFIPSSLTEAERRLLDWHWANLEYGCSARLSQISLANWNQDEEFGGFGPPHCMVKGGYSTLTDALAKQVDVRLGQPVKRIAYNGQGVTVSTAAGEKFRGQHVIVTATLGCLKAGDIKFDPELPKWKSEAIATLGFGNLNKICMEFPHCFWDAEADYFGVAVGGGPRGRGQNFMFWNNQRFCGRPVLTALLSGASADRCEQEGEAEVKARAVSTLRRLFGEQIPEPTASVMTCWRQEPYSRGSYSFVGLDASGKTYDTLATPVQRRVLFAGEHTCKEHPDTVGGAMLTGVREAVRALHMLKGDDEDDVDVAAGAVDAPVLSKKRSRVEEEAADAAFLASEEEDGGAHPGKRVRKEQPARRRRPEEATYESAVDRERRMEAAHDAAAAQRHLDQQKKAREESTVIWTAVMMASNGDSAQLRQVMDSYSSQAQRLQILTALLDRAKQQQQGRALACLAANTDFLQHLGIILLEAASEPDGTQLAEKTMQVLDCMHISWNLLHSEQLISHVAFFTQEHRPKVLRDAAAALQLKWQRQHDEDRSRTAKHQQRRTLAERLAGQKAPGSDSREGASAAAQKSLAGASPLDVDTAPQPVPPVVKTVVSPLALEEMDPEVAAKIAEAEAAQKRAHAEAQQAAEEALAIESQLQLQQEAAGQQAQDGFVSFQRFYKDQLKAQQQRKANKYSNRGRQHHHSQPSSKHKVADKGRDKVQENGSGGPKEKQGAGGEAATRNKLSKEIDDYAAAVLKPIFKSKQLSKEGYKWVVKSTVEKVLRGATGNPAEGTFLTDVRKQKIDKLLTEYVKRAPK